MLSGRQPAVPLDEGCPVAREGAPHVEAMAVHGVSQREIPTADIERLPELARQEVAGRLHYGVAPAERTAGDGRALRAVCCGELERPR